MVIGDLVFVMRRSPSLLAAFLLLLLPCFFTLQYAGRGGGCGGGGDRGEAIDGGGARGGEAGGRAALTSENENVATASPSAPRAEDDDHLHHRLRRLFRIPEASEGRLLQGMFNTSSISTIDAALVADGTSVVKFLGESPFNTFLNGSELCAGPIPDVALSRDGTVLYYRLLEACMDPAFQKFTKLRYSFREAKPGTATALAGGGRLLSYWWPAANPSGRANMTAFIFEDPLGSDRINPMMNFISSMDVTKSDTHLAVFPTPIGIGKRMIVFIEVASGDRTAIEVSDVDSPGSLAFARLANERLYIADTAAPYRILSAPMLPGADGIPMSSTTVFAPEANFPKGGRPNITETKFAGQSLDSQGRCLYFSDSTNLTVWSLDLTSPSSRSSSASESPMSRNATHVAGSGKKKIEDGPGLSASFWSLSHPVVTRDGCNVFVVDDDTVRWIKLSSPCSTALKVTSVAKVVATNFWSLALFDNGTSNPLLYLGTMDGQVYKLEINRAALHSCRSEVPNPPIPSLPSSSPPPPPPSLSAPNVSQSSPPPPSPPSSSSPPAVQDSSSSKSPKDNPSPAIIVVPVVCGLAVLLIVVGVAIVYCRRINRPLEAIPVTQSTTYIPSLPLTTDTVPLNPAVVRAFGLTDLRFCTNDFDQSYLIGDKGAFGEVYWGSLGGTQVAIKVMHGELTAAKRRQFVAEVNTLTRLHHANLIQLIGYCDEGNRCILVYPYFAGGSLHSRLHKRVGVRGAAPPPPLTLSQRMSIISQIAEGLRYLHCGANPRVIHRDVKSSNVLLSDGADGSLQVVLADFGTAAITENVFETGHQSVVKTCQLAGTRGYIAPEYLLRGRLTAKNDVFAFGVVVLELMTGKPAILRQSPVDGECQALAEWVREISQRSSMSAILGTIIDPCLRSIVETNVVIRNMVIDEVNLGMTCSQLEDEQRPIMSSVCDRLTVMLSEAKGRGIYE
ncbi:hypothetical protein CBR_g22122 [Chara braunii]|uniref:Protein kinase domain-containing protein n=1 Tax=Chara braunii TaxID=69332 RepID=A0A388L243_CHABU|nr:hypothetical protein CBR_g22122 [Chara braunii]|eukprot:GBG76375.1 hypothetical protein CBR_g22122 [Chara braunii]